MRRDARGLGDEGQIQVDQLEIGEFLQDEPQDRLHQQGFGRAPVDDLLAPIRDRIPAICQAEGVERIVPVWSWAAVGKKQVDVTDRLVAEYKPSEKTLQTIAELRKHPAIIGPVHCD